MKLSTLFLLASLVVLGAACPLSGSVTPTKPAIPVIATLTPEIPATSLPTTSQATTEATVAPRTTTAGPYLAYLRDQGNGQELVLMDADGKGEVVFPFPMNSDVYMPRSLSNLVSPDGIWLAFYTGSAKQTSGNGGTDTADLTLNLMNLSDSRTQAGSTQVIARLLSADYPVNFAQAAQELGRSDITAQVLQDAFVYGITQSIAWSPDGLHLAFAGQMNGLSSDLYLYNTADGTIQQLSSGPEEVEWIEWSPDGKWILDASAYWTGEGMTFNLYATMVDGKVVRRLLENSMLDPGLRWINAHAFLAYHSTNGPGSGLERVDVASGSVDKVWDGRIDSLAVDKSGAWLALHDYENGLFLIDLATLKSTKVQVPDATHVYGTVAILSTSLEPARLFMTWDETDLSLYYLSTNGALKSAGISANFFSIAPNQVDWIAIKDNNIQSFLGGGSQARIFKLPDGTDIGDFQAILWRPDSSGIFLASSAGQLYALDFSSGISTLVEQYLSAYDPVTGIPAGLIWIRK